jgi:hypothetical protein
MVHQNAHALVGIASRLANQINMVNLTKHGHLIWLIYLPTYLLNTYLFT